MDKTERCGIRMHDFINKDKFIKKLYQVGEIKNSLIEKFYGGKALNLDDIVREYSEYAERLSGFVSDTSVAVFDALKAGKEVLFEGAQGTLLDLDMGTYPYVTSSHPVAGGVCIGSGIGPTLIDEAIGVAKGYTTRVGKGPFPTELFDDTGEYIRQKGAEFGTTTGRPRRTGWFDAVIARFAVRVNGLTSLVINKVDPLAGLPVLKLCTAYERNGKIITDFPADLDELAECKPVYEEFDGFDMDLGGMRRYSELPTSLKKYIEAIEHICGCPVSIIGVGPGRDQIIYKG
jgi:adenylosuccinate synthase